MSPGYTKDEHRWWCPKSHYLMLTHKKENRRSHLVTAWQSQRQIKWTFQLLERQRRKETWFTQEKWKYTYTKRSYVIVCSSSFYSSQKFGSNLSFYREMNGSTICSTSIQQNTTWPHRRGIADAPIRSESQSLGLREQNQNFLKKGGAFILWFHMRNKIKSKKKKALFYDSIYMEFCVC